MTGTGPVDPVTGKLVGDDIEQQTEQTIDNIVSILEAEGAPLGERSQKSPCTSAPLVCSRATTLCMRNGSPSRIRCGLRWEAIWGIPPEC